MVGFSYGWVSLKFNGSKSLCYLYFFNSSRKTGNKGKKSKDGIQKLNTSKEEITAFFDAFTFLENDACKFFYITKALSQVDLRKGIVILPSVQKGGLCIQKWCP